MTQSEKKYIDNKLEKLRKYELFVMKHFNDYEKNQRIEIIHDIKRLYQNIDQMILVMEG